MSGKPPQPMIASFLVCREMYVTRTGDLLLIAPCNRFTIRRFPTGVPVAVYADMTDGRGKYEATLQLVNQDGEAVWNWGQQVWLDANDPLLPCQLKIREVVVVFPSTGRFDLHLLINDDVLAHRALMVDQN